MAQSMASQSRRRTLFGDYRWIPWVIVACFVLVAAVNGGLIYFASESWPGLTTDHAYNEGLAYNKVLDESAAEAKMGWKIDIDFAPLRGAQGGTITILARDATGAALGGLAFKGDLVRPVGAESSFETHFVYQGEGRYVAKVTLPYPGQWNLYLAAERGADRWHGGRRLQVPVS